MKIKTLLSIAAMLLVSSVFALALDLRFTTAITMTPDPASAGNTVTFSVNWKNFSGAVDNMVIHGGVDGTMYLNYTYAHLDSAVPQETKTFTWTATSGAHTAWFELDPSHTCGDSDYSNNRVELAFTVAGGPAGQPNLKPTVSYSPNDFEAGNTVTFNIRVDNNGTADAVASQMQVIKGASTTLHTFNVAAITTGNHVDKTYTWTAECDAHISIKVDSSDTNAESNEGDNIWTKEMACGGGDDSDGPFHLCPQCWKIYKIIEFDPIPLPDPCLSCPPWHDIFRRGDPIDILNKIGEKLGNGLGFDDVKGDWLKFLGKNNGLRPNAALKIIFDKAVVGGKARLKGELDIKNFQTGLNLALGQLHGLAKQQLGMR